MDQGNVIARCSQCGAKNRIPASRIQDHPVCGRCRTPLPLGAPFPEHPIEITDRSFPREVTNFLGPVVVYLWSPTCGHCRRLSPVVEELAREYAGRLKFTKMIIDQNRMTASQYNVQGVPTLLLFNQGRLVNQVVGALPKAELERAFRAIV